jgi:hypothetical protein
MSEAYASTKTELARRLGLRYATLCGWFKAPDRPRNHSPGTTRYDVEAWRQWIGRRTKSHRLGNSGQGSNGEVSQPFALSEREKALTEKASIEAERSRFKLAIERGEYLERQGVCNAVEQAHSLVRRQLNKALLCELLPALEGLTSAQMRRPVRRVIDELSDNLVQQFNDYAVAGAECI